MQEKNFKAGRVIYREGDSSRAIYVVKSGEVEVLRATDGEAVLLGTLREGDIFGEMGVIRDRPRSTTTRAAVDTVLVEISREQFHAAFKENALALRLLRILCERLRAADDRLARRHYHETAAEASRIREVRLLPGSPVIRTQIGEAGIVLKTLPFRVGRRPQPDDPPHLGPTELQVRGSRPREMARDQFVIEELDGRLRIRDLGSILGTVVNGVRIADFEESSSAPLNYGENDVVAGGADSQMRFRVQLIPR